ncbi:MAG: ABC transporter permease [Actinomycetota bacterium]
MLRASLKSLLARKMRLALTGIAVVLGVAFVAGTYVLTDTMNAAFDEGFASASAGIDVVVRGESDFQEVIGSASGGGDDRRPIPEAVLEDVSVLPGVASAGGEASGFAQFIDPKTGDPLGGFGPPTLGSSWDPREIVLRLVEGSPPAGPAEVVIDEASAQDVGARVGSKVEVVLEDGPSTSTVSGLVDASDLLGVRVALFDLPTAQKLFDKEGQLDSITVVAEPGTDSGDLRAQIDAALPDGYEAILGTTQAQEGAESLKEGLGFIRTALLVFAFVALFVGAFIIFNTFSIIVAQRSRELGLLRALGASRRQVLGATLTEAAIVGLFASIVGVLAGIGLAIGLKGLLTAFGLELPGTGTQIEVRTLVVSLVLGVVVTALSAVLPARRSATVAPIEALREGTQAVPRASLRRRLIIGAIVSIAGVASLLYGLFAAASSQLQFVGLGVFVTFLGVAVLAPLFARPLSSFIGAPLARLGITGYLGRENAKRNPRRTASTASALMIGLALVAFVSVLGASLKASTTAALEDTLKADLIVLNPTFQPLSTKAATQIEAVPEVDAVTRVRQEVFQLEKNTAFVTAVDPATVEQTTSVGMIEGSVDSLNDGMVLVFSGTAEDHGWTVGDVVPMRFALTGLQEIQIGGLYDEDRLLDDFVISLETYDANYLEGLDSFLLVKGSTSVPPKTLAGAVEGAVADLPGVEVQDQATFRETQAGFIDQLLNLISALLSLAILIALFGIANTLSLSIFERTRELGLLRAVGMTRRQLRSMVRWEAVIIAILGAVLGLTLGILFGWALQQALVSEGITELAIPTGQLIGYVIFAGLAGVVTALLPARRAAKLKVLDAIAYE